jgi:hypothetical protein
VPAVPQHAARQVQDPPRLPHPAPAGPPLAGLTAGGADPDRVHPEPEDPFGAQLDELSGFSTADPGPLGAIRAAFALGQVADSMSPGSVLAGLSEHAWQHGLAGLDEDQLTGMLQAANRLAAWSAALRLAAVSELAGRRAASAEASGDRRPLDHVRDELAITLTLTGWGADRLLGMAMALDRLPLTQAALATGTIDERRADVIADELAGLSDEHAARVEAMLLPKAAAQTTAELRRAARRAVMSADPAAAKQRKEKALQDARVETFTEAAGTAALAGRDLPAAAVLAADQNLTSLAMAMRQGGAGGTLDQLRAHAYLHLLAGQPAGTLTGSGADTGQPPAGTSPAAAPPSGAGPSWPALRGTIQLTMPLASWLGWSERPGEAAGYGPLDADDSRALAARLAAHPASTWCLTLTGPAGWPVAHGCARAGPSPGRPTGAASRAGPGPDGGGAAATGLAAWLNRIPVKPLQTRDCAHPRLGHSYQPGPGLRHLVEVRNATCIAPGCRRPAGRCDLDHTTPYHLGGLTCECNLGPLCRHHHRCKQLRGWSLVQVSPGTFTWCLPSRRNYQTTPTEYPS